MDNKGTAVTLDCFLSMCRQIVDERPVYRSGGSGADRTCDCIGLIIGAVRRAGGVWTGTHGSNYAARYEMQTLKRVSSVKDLAIGMAIYKAREPGHKKYALPSTYKSHSDQKDYYHVGVVDSVEPLRIVHVTSSGSVSGPMVDTTLGVGDGAWAYAGMLDKVDYGAGGGAPSAAVPEPRAERLMGKVCQVVGGGLNLRGEMDANGVRVTQIPEGAMVTCYDDDGTWALVAYAGGKGYGGYVKSAYLRAAG